MHLKHEFEEKFVRYDIEAAESNGSVITVSSVEKSIGKLKNGKAASIDGLAAEHLKLAHPKPVVLLCVLFNKIMTCGKVPELFCSGCDYSHA